MRLLDDIEFPSLLTFEVLDTLRDSEVSESNWPVFSQDVNSRYSFYITDTTSVNSISLTPWVFRLENELKDASAGADFRIDLLSKGDKSTRQRLWPDERSSGGKTQGTVKNTSIESTAPLAASAVIQDPDLGYLLLTANKYGPIALIFESPDFPTEIHSRASSVSYDDLDKPLILCETRPVYEPAHELDAQSAIPAFLERLNHSKYKRVLKEDVRLSPATLQIMTDAHKIISEETHRIGTAAAEVFRRCERLQIDLKMQIEKAHDVAARVEAITGHDLDDGPALTRNDAVEERIRVASEKQRELTERIEAIRKKVTRGTSRELSDKEKAWFTEVHRLEEEVLKESVETAEPARSRHPRWVRYEDVMDLKEDLLMQVEAMELTEETETVLSPINIKVPMDVKKAKMHHVMGLLDRETALVEGAKSRLERLTLC